MTAIAGQVHDKFKVFSGKLASDQTLGSLAASVEGWVKAAKVAPKSIGVEYIEHSGALLLSIGYRDDEPAYAIKLATVRIGKIEATDAAGLAQIESAMAKATEKLGNIICHELYVTDAGDLLMVFMTHQAAS
jgi:hypothetical protein